MKCCIATHVRVLTHNPLYIAALSLMCLFAAASLHAAPVTWGTPTTVTSVDDIDLTGTLVHAGSWGTSNLTVVVGGETILFEDRPVNATDGVAGVTGTEYGAAYGTFYTGDTGSTHFNEILDSIAGGPNKVLTLEGLVPGAGYQVQLFASDERTTEGKRTQKWSDHATDGAGHETRFFARNEVTHTIGTFTADAVSQVIHALPGNDPNTIVNGYVLRKTADAAHGTFFDPASGEVVETGQTGQYAVQTTTIPGSPIDVTATAPADLELSLDGISYSNSITVVLNGILSATVLYRAIGDGILEPAENVDITHTVQQGDGANYTNGMPLASLSIRVIDAPTALLGDLAVYANTGFAGTDMDAGDVYTNRFSETVKSPVGGYILNNDGDGILMSPGKHLVLYNTRINNVSGPTRANVLANLSLASDGMARDLAYGWSHGYIRNTDGADETVLSGGAVIDAASGDMLHLVTRRTDANATKITRAVADQTAIQLLKFDDNLDTLSLSRTNNVPAALNTYSNVTYNSIDEGSAGAMSFSNGTGNVTLIESGHYLVFANTTIDRTGLSQNGTRISYTQRLLLDDSEVVGSKTTTYIRGEVDADGCFDGVAALGMVIEATTGQDLQVQLKQEGAQVANIIGARTGLTIIKLPDTGQFIKLEDTNGQDLNPATRTPVVFDTQNGTPGAVFTHSAATTSSVVTVNQEDRYLFLGAFYCDQDQVDRQSVNQHWNVNGDLTGYGQSSRYSRNDVVFDNGNWSGMLVDLDADNEVEMTSVRLAANGVLPGHSVGFQGVSLLSLTTNPVLVTNDRLIVVALDAATIDTGLLRTVDADTPTSNLVYTVDSTPTGGMLVNGGLSVTRGQTFTQADIDAGNVGFTANVTPGESFGFAFTVSDGGGAPVSGYFTIKVAEAIVLADDSGVTDEDTLISTLTGGATSVLDNDSGEALAVTAHDALSANGAEVVMYANGVFRYNPDPAIVLQKLSAGDATNDTFTYTVTDARGAMATATVTVAVSGAEDAFAAVGNYVDDPTNTVYENAGASITVNLTANDGIVRTANGTTNDVLVLNYDAAARAAVDRWENTGSLGGSTMDWILDSGVTRQAVASARSGITAAYVWDGSTSAKGTYSSGGGTSIQNILGNGTIDTGSASFEFWVRLDAADLAQNSTLFETGGGTGVGIVIGSNGVLRAANGILIGEVTYDLVTDSQGLVGGDPTAEFFQVVFVVDLDRDLNSLYVNGVLVGTAVNTATTDWDGGDGSGLGHFGESNHGGFQNTAAGTDFDTYFHGAMAAFRVYSEAFSPADVFQNFHAIDQGGIDMEGDVLTVSGIYDASTNLVAGTGTPIVLTSGGVVTLNDNTGSFTYDPTGIPGISDLTAGETRTDTFDIRVIDDNGQSDHATVSVAIHGLASARDDVLEATEFSVATFAASELVGNDQHPVGTAGALVNLDANDVTASNVADRAWLNTGTGGATYDGTVSGGTLVSPASRFGALGTAWESPGIAAASLDAVSTVDATFEVWFKPRFGSGKQVLFESGGNGVGISIVYDGTRNEVVCTLDSGVDTDPNVQLRATVPGVSYDAFNQLVVVYDRDNPSIEDSLTLYLNSDPGSFDATPVAVTNLTGGVNDWSGTDGFGIGLMSGTAALNEALTGFEGQLAALRVYTRVLSAAEIEANFDATAQPVLTLPPGSLVTTALGAVVTLNADGSVTYDATGLSSNITAGEVAQDTFTYTIDDGVGGTSVGTVTVNVTGLGASYAADDGVAVGEDGPAVTFDPRTNDVGLTGGTIELETVVAGYRADYQDGTAQGDLADFSATTGWRYMWNAPVDWDGTNSLDGTTGPLGDSANYELLKWNSTGAPRWCPDGDNDNLNGKPGNYLRFNAAGGHPGRGANQDEGITNNLDRAAIAAYTVSKTGYYGIRNSFLRRTAAGQTIQAVVYVEDTHIGTVTLPGGVTGDFDMELGQVGAGETIYVGAAPDVADGSDGFEWDFTIVELPGEASELLATLGTVTTDGTNITYDPNGRFETLPVGQSVSESFQYTVRDDTNIAYATVTVRIDGANDAPTGMADANTTDEDSTAAGMVLGNDTDIDQGDVHGLTVGSVQGAPGNVGVAAATDGGGSVTMSADGNYVYDPNGQFESLSVGDTDLDTFIYAPRDVHGLVGSAVTVTVSIAGADDGVIATDNDYGVKADAAVAGNVITDDTGDGVDVSIDANDPLFLLSADTTNVRGLLTLSVPAFMGTRGTVTNLSDTVQTVTFDAGGGRFTDPVVFANPPSYNETEPVIVLITNVNAAAGTFNIWLKEQPEINSPPGTNDMDGAMHAAESVSWFVLEAGQYRLANGKLMEVGTVDTAAIRAASWETVSFTVPFTNAPVVFNQLQTFSGNTNEQRELFGTRMNGPATTNSFQVALEDYQGASAPRATAETIGWLAMEPGAGMWSGNTYEAGITAATVNQNGVTITFTNDYGSAPAFIASQASILGTDPTQLRHANLDGDSVDVLAREDTVGDTETGHAMEQVTYLAVGGSGDLTAYPTGVPIGGFVYDPNGVFDGLGSGQVGTEVFTYTLTDGRGNTDTKTVTITVRDSRSGMLIIVK